MNLKSLELSHSLFYLFFFYSLLDQTQTYAGNVTRARKIVELKKKKLKYTRTECYQS